MDFVAISKSDTADDADPRTTPPDLTGARVFELPVYCDQASRQPTACAILRAAVFNSSSARIAGATVILTLYLYDGKGAVWLKVDSSPALGNDALYSIGFPSSFSPTKAFLQVTSVTGAGKDHVEIAWAPGGPLVPDMNIGTVNVNVPGGVGLATAAKQDTGNASLGSIDTKLTSQATAAKQDTGNTSLASVDTKLSSQATAANQATMIADLVSIDGHVDGLEASATTTATQTTATAASVASIDTKSGPVAAALSDALANPTTGLLGSCTLVWDTSQWRRLIAVADNSAQAVKLPTLFGTANAAAPSWTEGRMAPASVDLKGAQRVAPHDSSGTRLFPDVAAEADAIANPSLTKIGTFLHGFNGTTWDRLLVDSNKVLKVTVTGTDGAAQFPAAAAPADAVTNAENTVSIRARLSGYNGTTWDRIRIGQSTATSTLTGFLNNIPFGIYNTTAPTPTNGQIVALQVDGSGSLKVTLATAIAGEDTTNDVLGVSPKARSDSSNAWTNYASQALIGTAGVSVKASAGRLRYITGANTNATTNLFLQVCNKATAPVANDLPTQTLVLPALLGTTAPFSQAADNGSEGVYYSTGIAFAISTVANKVTLPGTSDVEVDARYL